MVDKSVIHVQSSWFIDSKTGNIKEEYYFEKKLGSGGYGAVYLAKQKRSGKSSLTVRRSESCSESYAEAKDFGLRLFQERNLNFEEFGKFFLTIRTTPTSLNCTKPGKQKGFASSSQSKSD